MSKLDPQIKTNLKIRSKLGNLYQFESHYADVGGFRMHYVDEGKGPVVLCLHGNPTWSFYYRNLIKELSKAARVIAPDHIGCGLSDHPRNDHFRAMDRVAHLERLLDHLGIDRFSLVMHDWGGPIGSFLAGRNPTRIEKMVFLNTTLTETESLPLIIRRAASPWIGKLLTKFTPNFIKLTTHLGVSKTLPADVKRAYFLPYRRRADRIAIWDFVADIPFDNSHPTYSAMLELADQLPQLREKPSLIIWGLRDPCFHQEMLAHVVKNFPHAKVVEISQASHLVLEDAPEIVIPEICSFFSSTGEGGRAKPKVISTNEGTRGAVQQVAATERSVNPLYASFVEMVHRFKHHDAVITPSFLGESLRYAHSSFEKVFELITKYERALSELGLKPGDRVLMLVSPGVEFLCLSYAVMGRGAIPVFVDPGVGKENMYRCIEVTKPDVFIGSPKAHLLRYFKKELFTTVRFSIWATDIPLPKALTLSLLKKFSTVPLTAAESTDTALIAFTSGGTGVPKGVIFSHQMLREQLRIFSEIFQITPPGKDFPLLPVFSIFSLALGTCTIFPPINPSKPIQFDVGRVVRVIRDLQIDFSFGSPTLWNKIAEYCIRYTITLPSISKIYMAGAPVSEEVLERVQRIAPNSNTCTPYGATEALPVTLVSARQIVTRIKQNSNGERQGIRAKNGELGTYVGKPVPGVQVAVIEAVNEPIREFSQVQPLAPFEIGEVIVRGKNVSPEYLFNPEATALAKIRDGETFWHRMGDVGYLDSDGHLYFCGRKAHVVATSERVFYPIPCERIFNELPRVKRCALISLKTDKSSDTTPGIVVEPHPESYPHSADEQRAFIRDLKTVGKNSDLTSQIEKFFFHPSFPVDGRHNAKIFRDQLSNWAVEQAAESDQEES